MVGLVRALSARGVSKIESKSPLHGRWTDLKSTDLVIVKHVSEETTMVTMIVLLKIRE